MAPRSKEGWLTFNLPFGKGRWVGQVGAHIEKCRKLNVCEAMGDHESKVCLVLRQRDAQLCRTKVVFV